MWNNFFKAGGFGMYPTLVFGFFLVGLVALQALRRDLRHERVVVALTVLTIASGMLGAVTGICKSALYLDQVPKDEQLQTFALGIQESLHNLILAFIIVVIAGLCYIAGVLRRRTGA